MYKCHAESITWLFPQGQPKLFGCNVNKLVICKLKDVFDLREKELVRIFFVCQNRESKPIHAW